MKRAHASTFRQLTDLSPHQLKALRGVLRALKGMRRASAVEVLQLANAVRGAR